RRTGTSRCRRGERTAAPARRSGLSALSGPRRVPPRTPAAPSASSPNIARPAVIIWPTEPSTLEAVPPLRTSSSYVPTGDPPEATAALADGLRAGERYQTLLGATGTGKTATMAWIIEQVQKPALVIAHNKTLAAQLCNEFREFFPSNAVEYFVSY